MIFGEGQYDDLPEEIIQVLVDSGVARSEWDAISRQMQIAGNYRNYQSAGYKLHTALRGLGIAWTTATALMHAWNHEQKGRTEGLGKRKPDNQIRADSKHQA